MVSGGREGRMTLVFVSAGFSFRDVSTVSVLLERAVPVSVHNPSPKG